MLSCNSAAESGASKVHRDDAVLTQNALEKKKGENTLGENVENDIEQNLNRLIDDASTLANSPDNLCDRGQSTQSCATALAKRSGAVPTFIRQSKAVAIGRGNAVCAAMCGTG